MSESSWWLNHPFVKYAQVKLGSSSPTFGVKHAESLKPPPINQSRPPSFIFNFLDLLS